MTQASHQLDLLQWLCGMPRFVLARCSTVNRPIQVENEAELFFPAPMALTAILLRLLTKRLGLIFWKYAEQKGA